MSVYLLTIGDGSPGDEWSVRGIYASLADAEAARLRFIAIHDWATASDLDIEEWEVGSDRWHDWRNP